MKAFCFCSSSLRGITFGLCIPAPADAAARSVLTGFRRRGRIVLDVGADLPRRARQACADLSLQIVFLRGAQKTRAPTHVETGQALDHALFKEFAPTADRVVVEQKLATSRQLHPSSKSTKALARRVTRQAADPSRANAISLWRAPLRSGSPLELCGHPNSPSHKTQGIYPDFSTSSGYSWKRADRGELSTWAPKILPLSLPYARPGTRSKGLNAH